MTSRTESDSRSATLVQVRCDLGKAVEQDRGRRLVGAGQRDVHPDPGGQRQLPFDHG